MRGVSIGFRPLEYSYLEGGGVRFTESEVYELSLATVPCNQSATIETIKALDRKQRGIKLVKATSVGPGAVKLLKPSSQ